MSKLFILHTIEIINDLLSKFDFFVSHDPLSLNTSLIKVHIKRT